MKKLYHLANVERRIMFYLREKNAYKNGYNYVPNYELSREGIARAIGVDHHNISRYLIRLKDKDYINYETVRLKKMPRKVTVYYLTSAGLKKTIEYINELINYKISFKNESGKNDEKSLKEILQEFGDDLKLYKITKKNIKNILEGRSVAQLSEPVKPEIYLPRTDEFFGRIEELRTITEKFNDGTKIIAVIGMAGIGKTSLILRLFEMWTGLEKKVYIKIENWFTFKNFLKLLSDYFLSMGICTLTIYLREHNPPDFAELLNIIDRILTARKFLFVFDDVQNAQIEIKEFLKAMFIVIQNHRNSKIVILGRSNPGLYSSRETKIQGYIYELRLSGLNFEDATQLMNTKKIPPEQQRTVYNMTLGSPLFIRLMSNKLPVINYDIYSYIHNEVESTLQENERVLIDYLSVFRRPVLIEGVINNGSTGYTEINIIQLNSLIDKSLLTLTPEGRIIFHDILRDYFYNSLNADKRRELHANACHYYSTIEPLMKTELLYHSYKCCNFENVKKILLSHGETILNDGYTTDILYAINILEKEKHSLPRSEKLTLWLLKLQAEKITGNTNGMIDDALRMLNSINSEPGNLSSEEISLIIKLRLNLIEVYRRVGNIQEAKNHLQKGIAEARKYRLNTEEIKLLYEFGYCCEHNGELNIAFRIYKHALKKARKLNIKMEIARLFYVIGLLKYKTKKYKIATSYFTEGLKYVDEYDNNYNIIRKLLYNGLGMCTMMMENYSEAKKNFQLVKELAELTCDERLIATMELNLGLISIEESMLEQGFKSIENALKKFKKINEVIGIARCDLGLAKYYSLIENRKSTIDRLNSALNLLYTTKNIQELKIAMNSAKRILKKAGWSSELKILKKKYQI